MNAVLPLQNKDDDDDDEGSPPGATGSGGSGGPSSSLESLVPEDDDELGFLLELDSELEEPVSDFCTGAVLLGAFAILTEPAAFTLTFLAGLSAPASLQSKSKSFLARDFGTYVLPAIKAR